MQRLWLFYEPAPATYSARADQANLFWSNMEKTLRTVRPQEEIRTRVAELGSQISSSVSTGELTVVGMLDDSFVFLADLIRAISKPVSCCFMKVHQHRHGGQTEIMFVTEFDPRGRDILLVNSVAATGVTLDYITKQLGDRGVKSLRTCVLIDKPDERRVDTGPDFSAFVEPNHFVFGYGLGIDNQYRQLPYLAVFESE
jgi:hypoxanthine phosphoribosyltransferase